MTFCTQWWRCLVNERITAAWQMSYLARTQDTAMKIKWMEGNGRYVPHVTAVLCENASDIKNETKPLTRSDLSQRMRFIPTAVLLWVREGSTQSDEINIFSLFLTYYTSEMENLWCTEKYDPFATQPYTIRH